MNILKQTVFYYYLINIKIEGNLKVDFLIININFFSKKF